MNNITESDSLYDKLEEKSVSEVLTIINREDQKVADAVEQTIPQISAYVERVLPKMKAGGRLFYIGAGTSGRLGILDASECPPTFGVPPDWVVGLIAGGDQAIRTAVEHAEDDRAQAWKDLKSYGISEIDSVVGIAASGTTPYVVGGIQAAREASCLTACISCNPGAPLTKAAEFPIVPVVGPEVVTGSSRMKAGTAQKMVLNMISTSLMIGLGRVEGHRMVDMQLSNDKLWRRAVAIIKEELEHSEEWARQKLKEEGSVRAVLEKYRPR
jgi:N-acetylmuramic acid 6-phosphate etherase